MIPGVVDNRVTIDIVDGIADVRMNRADKRNALDNAMFASLAAAGEFLKTNTEIRAVVLSGSLKRPRTSGSPAIAAGARTNRKISNNSRCTGSNILFYRRTG